MKRVLFVITCFIFASHSFLYAQFPPQYNLEQGRTYSIQEAIDSVNNSIVKWDYNVIIDIDTDTKNDFIGDALPQLKGVFTYLFSLRLIPTRKDSGLPNVYLRFAKNGEYCFCSQIYGPDSFIIADKDTLRRSELFNHLYRSISAKYPLKHNKNDYLYSKDNISIALSITDDGSIIILYDDYSPYANTVYEALQPEIQSSFLGISLGEVYEDQEISYAIANRGSFTKMERTDFGKCFTGNKVSFGGHIWDYCIFDTDHLGKVFSFKVYDSRSIDSNGLRETKRIYKEFKSTLDSKYGINSMSSSEERDIHSIRTTYFGKQNITLELYDKTDKSKGGQYRRFIGLTYSDMKSIDNTIKSANNEL